MTEDENEEPILERRGSFTLVEHGTSFLALHIDKDGNNLFYYLGRGSLVYTILKIKALKPYLS